jgi:hypothetical protein
VAEYTPTTEQMRDVFANLTLDSETRERRSIAFDRWLSAHDAEVRASERERAALHAEEGYRWGENCDDIAKRIRSGEPAEIAAREVPVEQGDET